MKRAAESDDSRRLASEAGSSALYTLHYRIVLQNGMEVVSTFGGRPATLAVGDGQLAPGLEACLAKARAGERMSWELTPENGFGIHRPELVQRMALSDFPAKVDVRPGAVIEFSSSDGLDRAGRVLGIADGMVTLDFNHPLSGKSIRFEADVIAIL